MSHIFPFNLPLPTALYLVFYVLALMLHVIFMNYVLAGTAYLAVASLFSPSPNRRSPEVELLRDWMPFALSGAITAGVAPLLVVQILYQRPFYTANLLLFHRWMSILPVLIVGFYLLYLLKSKRIETWRPIAHRAVAVIAFLCFAFTGYSWTENHLLSLDQSVWPSQYAAQSMWYSSTLTIPRFAVWFFGSFSAMGLILLWQVRGRARSSPVQPAAGPQPQVTSTAEASLIPMHDVAFAPSDVSRTTRRIALVAIAGLILSSVCAAWYYFAAGNTHRRAILDAAARPYLVAATLGVLTQVAGWTALRGGRAGGRTSLYVTSLAALISIAGTSAIRESVRVAQFDMTSLAAMHARTAEAGGLPVFMAFLLINGLLIALVIRIVHRTVA